MLAKSRFNHSFANSFADLLTLINIVTDLLTNHTTAGLTYDPSDLAMELIDVELDKDYYSWNDEKKAIYCRDQLLLLHNKETAVTAYINNVLNMYSFNHSLAILPTHSPVHLFTVKMRNI